MRRAVICLLLVIAITIGAIDSIDKQPFLFRVVNGQKQPIPTISTPKDSETIQLDDGSSAVLSIRQLGERIGGIVPGEDYEIVIRNSSGNLLASKRVVACYERFQLAASDLIGGKGDEVLFISQTFHGSPFYNPILTIYKLGPKGLKVIGTTLLGSFVSPCTLYADEVTIQGSLKPARLNISRQWEECGEDMKQFKEYTTRCRSLEWSPAKAAYSEKTCEGK